MRDRGVLAVFESRDRLLAAVRAAKARHLAALTAFAPAYDEELVELASPPSRSLDAATLAGAIVGTLAGFALTVWTTAQWPTLIVSGKPLISIPPFVLIAFESMVLIAILAAVAAFLRRAVSSRPKNRAGYDPAFTDAHFGLLIRCGNRGTSEAIDLVQEAGAVRWSVV